MAVMPLQRTLAFAFVLGLSVVAAPVAPPGDILPRSQQHVEDALEDIPPPLTMDQLDLLAAERHALLQPWREMPGEGPAVLFVGATSSPAALPAGHWRWWMDGELREWRDAIIERDVGAQHRLLREH